MGLLKRIYGSKDKAESGTFSPEGECSSAGSTLMFMQPSMKSRVVEFQIELEDMHRVWRPNEVIHGTIKLRLKKELPPLWLRLSHIGESQIRSNNPMTTGALKPKCTETLVRKSIDLYGSEKEPLMLTKGEHKFPFSCKVPSKNVASSIDFERGSIKYWIQGELYTKRSPPLICKQKYQLVVSFNVAQLPKPNIKTVVLQSPSSSSGNMRKLIAGGSADHQDTSSSLTRKTMDSPNSSSSSNDSGNTVPVDAKTVKISVEIPSLGYTVGEDISVKVNVKHYKQYFHPAGLIATLVRICRVYNQGNPEQTETFRKDICQSVAPLYTDPDSKESVILLKLKVPLDTFPTLHLKNKFFSFQYYVEVLANLSRKNLVYTESNRLVGGQSAGDILIQSNKLSMIPKVLRSGGENEDEDGSITFFQDLINVDKLKRLRNVTGMSIEVIIGTHREKNSAVIEETMHVTPAVSAVPVVSDNDEDAYELVDSSPIDQIYDSLLQQQHPRHCCSPDSTTSMDNDDTLYYQNDPVPLYTPEITNTYGAPEANVTDDKQELEHMRLKQLESEPPI